MSHYNYCEMADQRHLLLGLATLLFCCAAEEWYMPDSSLISDQEFDSKVKQDKQSFKFVKYFTPHCPYCRYLKAVFDQLKHTRQWCFQIYDFNCQWYPQFCMNNVRSASFPYTAIHDQTGALIEEIHGFYPEPVISTIFNRIEDSCMAARAKAHSGAASGLTQAQASIPEAPLVVAAAAQPMVVAAQQPATIQPIELHQGAQLSQESQLSRESQLSQESQAAAHAKTAQHLSSPAANEATVSIEKSQKRDMEAAEGIQKDQLQIKQQRPVQPPHKEQQKVRKEQHKVLKEEQQVRKEEQQVRKEEQKAALPPPAQSDQQSASSQHSQNKAHAHSQPHQQPQLKPESQEHPTSRHNYIFYGVCLLCAGYYVYSLHSDEQNPETKQKDAGKSTSKVEQAQEKGSAQIEPQLTMEESELLQHVPDQEL